MKKVVILILALVLFVACFVGCEDIYNKQIFDGNYKFDYAYVNCGNEVIEGPIKSWTDYDDCDMMQVTFENEQVYYTHGSNIILVKRN